MGPSVSVSPSSHSIPFSSRKSLLNLEWTAKFDHQPVQLSLWAAPSRYDGDKPEVFQGNRSLLQTLQLFSESKLITLTKENIDTIHDSTVPKEKRTGNKFYNLSVFIVLGGNVLKLIVEYKGRQLDVVKDYKYIVPKEDLFEGNKEQYLTMKLSDFEGSLRWRQVRQTLEGLALNQHINRLPEEKPVDQFVELGDPPKAPHEKESEPKPSIFYGILNGITSIFQSSGKTEASKI